MFPDFYNAKINGQPVTEARRRLSRRQRPPPRNRPRPAHRRGELLVKVAVCGVCPTDIKKIQHGTVPPPRIFGHETAGVISKLGSGASDLGWKIGDRVALHHHVPCLDCHFCRHHAFAQCETYKRTGITAGFEPAGGGYAEYVRVMPFVLPGVVKIPAKNSFAEGAMLEPVNTVLKAVRRLSLLPGDVVLVAGQGPIGLMFTRLRPGQFAGGGIFKSCCESGCYKSVIVRGLTQINAAVFFGYISELYSNYHPK
jgi:threonine dehydrogenase-like Zn-dependent dehydrogenase